MKIGRQATLSHIVDGDKTYVIIDAPYIDCGHASEYRYCNGTCRCDACTDKHTSMQNKRNHARCDR